MNYAKDSDQHDGDQNDCNDDQMSNTMKFNENVYTHFFHYIIVQMSFLTSDENGRQGGEKGKKSQQPH